MVSPTSKEVLDHLLTNVIEVDTNDIKTLARAAVKFYKKLVSIKLKISIRSVKMATSLCPDGET